MKHLGLTRRRRETKSHLYATVSPGAQWRWHHDIPSPSTLRNLIFEVDGGFKRHRMGGEMKESSRKCSLAPSNVARHRRQSRLCTLDKHRSTASNVCATMHVAHI